MSVVGGEGISAEQAAEWLIAELQTEAQVEGALLTQRELDLLRTPVWDMRPEDRDEFGVLNNRAVSLTRRAIERSKANGAPCDKVRRGLRIPTDWRVHYQVIFAQELPWALSGILQNAVMNNPLAGERRPWKSK